ncbi:hypothetical protein [Pseudoroseicyclus aestuarii]|uniref:Uncharacterized protein n=1 Tax=Pseudoroseicyclus aestuarii TaxID=1795041 RepID=A0A318T7A2_9RHOB|nr:hypothetical protein [Pseudoroseicyclus aestuarii]PYE84278.1 hypothetical protein DFP88_10273 [Pseudoroseicyclus aestuarii]
MLHRLTIRAMRDRDVSLQRDTTTREELCALFHAELSGAEVMRKIAKADLPAAPAGTGQPCRARQALRQAWRAADPRAA